MHWAFVVVQLKLTRAQLASFYLGEQLANKLSNIHAFCLGGVSPLLRASV